MMLPYQTMTLSNGLRIIHQPIDSPVSYCGFAVKTGTRDEEDHEHGLAHFVEHILFKGTQHRSSYHILNRMEAVGGELNAYTTKEETFLYTVFLQQDFDRAFDLLADLLFSSVFPQKEIEKEAEVIIDEINSYNDSPSELIFDEFENLLFEGQSLGHNILGDIESVSRFTTNNCKTFVEKHYVPSNIIFFSMGSVPFKKIEHLAKKHLELIPANDYTSSRIIRPFVSPRTLCVEKDTHQAHVIIGSKAFDLFDKRRIGAYFLNNILGGNGMNSRLNLSLREKHGYVYSVESNLTNYTDCGISSIYFGSDPKNTDRCIGLIHKELSRIRNEKLTSSQLTAAKKQIVGQLGIANENRENLALAMGKSFLYFDRYESLEDIYRKIDAITSEQLLDIANQLYNEQELFTLIYR